MGTTWPPPSRVKGRTNSPPGCTGTRARAPHRPTRDRAAAHGPSGRTCFTGLVSVVCYSLLVQTRTSPHSRFEGSVYCAGRSEEHTSELQSRLHLVCRLLLEKKKIGSILNI